MRPWIDFAPIASFHAAYLLHDGAFVLMKRWKTRGGAVLDRWIAQFPEEVLLPLGQLNLVGLVPIPQKQKRFWELQRSPARVIAQALGRELELPVLDLLEDRSLGFAQARASKEERLKKNFTLRERMPAPQGGILLIDDFLTTGQTLKHAAEALAQNGVREIHAFALGRKPLAQSPPPQRSSSTRLISPSSER